MKPVLPTGPLTLDAINQCLNELIENSGTASTINGLVEAGTNVTITGTGTETSPYNISAAGGGGGSGTVTNVSVVTANGVSGSVSNPTTTPAVTLTLGDITPSSVAATGTIEAENGLIQLGTYKKRGMKKVREKS